MEWYRRFLRQYGFAGLLLSVLAFAFAIQLLLLVGLGANGFNQLFRILSLPAELHLAAQQPWSLLTYWLLSPPLLFWQFLIQMVILYTFGHILNAMLGDRRVQGLFVLSVLFNGLLTLGLANLIPTVHISDNVYLFGMHSVITSFIAAGIALVPRYNFKVLFWNIPLLFIGLFLMLLNFLVLGAIFSVEGIGVLAGCITGFGYIFALRKGTDLSNWLQFGQKKEREMPSRRPEPALVSSKPIVRSIRQKESTKTTSRPQMSEEEELDLLLDRINEVGYDGLSKSEKERLEQLSKN